MIVVGIDPSLTSTGVARVHPDGSIGVERVRSRGTRADTWAMRAARIVDLTVAVVEASAGASLAVIEGPAYAQGARGSSHDRSGLWWAIATALPCPLAVVTPTGRAKYATGRGNAGKDEVLLAVARRYPGAPVDGNDTADALILAAMGARHLGMPVEASLPVAHLAAMGAVAWATHPHPAGRRTAPVSDRG